MGEKQDEKADQFYEAMPATMDAGRPHFHRNRPWARSMLPWLILPAIHWALKTVWKIYNKPKAK